MDEEPQTEKALGIVRREYEKVVQKMTEKFVRAFEQSGWTLKGILPQSKIFTQAVKKADSSVAYFLVDAMRYEMAVELKDKLAETQELTIQPAWAHLPTITQVGMAALLPEASASFSVVEHKDRIAAKIEGTTMAGVNERIKFFKSKIPGAVDMVLGTVLQSSVKALEKKTAHAPVVIVRSQEIDALGEIGDNWFIARQFMDMVIDNIARAVKKLAHLGIERFVITADHGYQFSLKKEDDMKIDVPVGNTVEIHRRCWAGRGGSTQPGTVRITGPELGYETDLDFIFPTGLAVFPAKGGLKYHHGGISLQELVIPVIQCRVPQRDKPVTGGYKVKISDYPETLTNRTFSVTLELVQKDLFSHDPVWLKPVLLHRQEQVGQAGMAMGAEFDRTRGCVKLSPGEKASVGIMLVRDDMKDVVVAVQEPDTDAVLVKTKNIPIKLGI